MHAWFPIWHWFVHVTGSDYGAPYGHWVWYDWHSGIEGSAISTIGLAAIALWWRGTCQHGRWCLRAGKHPAADGKLRLCWKHHPEMGHKPHHLMPDGRRFYEHLHEQTEGAQMRLLNEIHKHVSATAPRAGDFPPQGGVGGGAGGGGGASGHPNVHVAGMGGGGGV